MDDEAIAFSGWEWENIDGPEAMSDIAKQKDMIARVYASSSSSYSGNAHQEFRSLDATDSTEINKATKKQKTEDTSAPERNKEKLKKTTNMGGPEEPPDLRQLIKDKIKNPTFGPVLILQKGLTDSDVSRNVNRLTMPILQLRIREFLQAREKVQASKRIRGGRGVKVNGLDVTVIDPVGDIIQGEPGRPRFECKVKLKDWKVGSSDCYVLTGAWGSKTRGLGSSRDLIDKKGLEKDDMIQVWFYRDADHKPCFAVVKL